MIFYMTVILEYRYLLAFRCVVRDRAAVLRHNNCRGPHMVRRKATEAERGPPSIMLTLARMAAGLNQKRERERRVGGLPSPASVSSCFSLFALLHFTGHFTASYCMQLVTLSAQYK